MALEKLGLKYLIFTATHIRLFVSGFHYSPTMQHFYLIIDKISNFVRYEDLTSLKILYKKWLKKRKNHLNTCCWKNAYFFCMLFSFLEYIYIIRIIINQGKPYRNLICLHGTQKQSMYFGKINSKKSAKQSHYSSKLNIKF